jgi:hypothetical protein
MKIGTLRKNQYNRVNFKTWVKQYWNEGIKKEFPIVRIFTPHRFDSFTLIMKDEENALEISRTVSRETGRQLFKEFGFSIKRATNGVLYFVLHENGEQEVVHVDDNSKAYVYEGHSFVLRDVNRLETLSDDIPF